MIVKLGSTPYFFGLIMLQCIVLCLNDRVLPPISRNNIQEHEFGLHQEVPDLNCLNETLRTDDYEMYPNSTLFVTKYHIYLDPSAYVQKNDSIAICKPPWVVTMDKITVGFLFSFIVFMVHVQTPIALFFGSLSKLFLTFVCAMPAVTLLSIAVIAGYSDFVAKCSIVMAAVAFINVSAFSWMVFLTSGYVLKRLESRQCIEITHDRVILKELSHISRMVFTVATILSVYTFLMINGTNCDVYPGIQCVERIEGKEMLIFFCPTIILFFLINSFYYILNIRYYFEYSQRDSVILKKLQSSHHKYMKYYMYSACMWFVGSFALIFDCWMLWYCFVAVNFVLPIYYVNELVSLKYLIYEPPTLCPEGDEGFDVNFKLGKYVFKLDLDKLTAEYVKN